MSDGPSWTERAQSSFSLVRRVPTNLICGALSPVLLCWFQGGAECPAECPAELRRKSWVKFGRSSRTAE